MARNIKGQITGEKLIAVKLNKTLQNIANEARVRLQALTRDKLENELRHQIYSSYTSVGSGEYQHTKLLPTSVYAVIEDDIVQAKLMNKFYKGVDSKGNTIDIPVEDVYNYLKFGTKSKAKSDVYAYVDDNGKIHYAPYKQTPAHNFEAETRKEMRIFLNEIQKNPEIALKPYLKKYENKRL